MRKEYLSIIKALSTVFFQEGFNREENKHGLEYWCISYEDLKQKKQNCRRRKVYGNEYVEHSLNTVNLNGMWYLRVFTIEYDEHGNFDDLHTDLLISVDTKRLCWEEMTKCANLISMTLFPYLEN